MSRGRSPDAALGLRSGSGSAAASSAYATAASGVQAGRVEERRLAVLRPEQQADLGAAEARSPGRRAPELLDHAPIRPRAKRRAHDAPAQLVVDDVVHDGAALVVGREHRQPVPFRQPSACRSPAPS